MHYRSFSTALPPGRKALLLSLLLCLPLAGCGGGGGGSASVVSSPVLPTPTPTPTPVPMPTPTPTPTPAPTATTISAPALQNFTVSLTENAATVPVGGTVIYTLTLINTSSSTATVIVDSANGQAVPQAALRVTDPSGATVYPVARPGTAHADPPPPPLLNLPATLAPGQSLTAIVRTVSAFATAGTYQAVATFTVAPTNNDPVQTVTLPALSVTAQ